MLAQPFFMRNRVYQNKNDPSEKLQIVTTKFKRAVSNSVSSNDTAPSLAF